MNTRLARHLRRSAPEPERVMWRLLYPLRQAGHHFRRQVKIGSYYVDFACHRPALAIEVDGDTHGTDLAASNDCVRDDYLLGRGYRVLRFWNNEVMENADGVYQAVVSALAEMAKQEAPPTPDPSPQGGGEGRDPAMPPSQHAVSDRAEASRADLLLAPTKDPRP